MITLTVIFCLKLNSYICKSLEVVPDDGHAIASVGECIRGGAVGGMSFTLENVEWQVKGWRCIERPNIVQAWRRDRQDKTWR